MWFGFQERFWLGPPWNHVGNDGAPWCSQSFSEDLQGNLFKLIPEGSRSEESQSEESQRTGETRKRHRRTEHRKRAAEAGKLQRWYRANKKKCIRNITSTKPPLYCEIPGPELEAFYRPDMQADVSPLATPDQGHTRLTRQQVHGAGGPWRPRKEQAWLGTLSPQTTRRPL